MNRLARVFPPARIRDAVFRIEWSKGNPFVAEYHVSRISVHQIYLLDGGGNQLIVSGKEHLRAFGKSPSEAAVKAFGILSFEVAKGH